MDKKEKIIAGVGIATVLGIAGYEYYKSKKTATSSSSTTSSTTSTTSSTSTTQPTKSSTSTTTSSTTSTTSSTTSKTSSSSTTTSTSTSATTQQTVTITVYALQSVPNEFVCYYDEYGEWKCVDLAFLMPHPFTPDIYAYTFKALKGSFFYYYIHQWPRDALGIFIADRDGPVSYNQYPFCAGSISIISPGTLTPLCAPPYTAKVTITYNYESSAQQPQLVQYYGTDLSWHQTTVSPGETVTISVIPNSYIWIGSPPGQVMPLVGAITNPLGTALGPITQDTTIVLGSSKGIETKPLLSGYIVNYPLQNPIYVYSKWKAKIYQLS